MIIRGIIFDLDGTLVDSVPLFLSAYKHAIKTCLGRKIDNNEILGTLGPNEIGVFKKIAPSAWEACLIEFYKYEKDRLSSVKTIDGIVELLAFLKSKGVLLGIVTGRAQNHASLLLKKFDLEQYFDCIEVGEEKRISKHSSIQYIIKKWSINKKSTLYVGDTYLDIEAARNVNVTPILAKWSSFSIDNISDESEIDSFSTVEEFSNWLRGRIV